MTDQDSATLLHKGFNEKEQKQRHRRETKAHECRGQGGKEIGPLGRDKGDDGPASADLTTAGERQTQA